MTVLSDSNTYRGCTHNKGKLPTYLETMLCKKLTPICFDVMCRVICDYYSSKWMSATYITSQSIQCTHDILCVHMYHSSDKKNSGSMILRHTVPYCVYILYIVQYCIYILYTIQYCIYVLYYAHEHILLCMLSVHII